MRRRRLWMTGIGLLVVSVAWLRWEMNPHRNADYRRASNLMYQRDFLDARKSVDAHLVRYPGDLDAILIAVRASRSIDDYNAVHRYLRIYEEQGGSKEVIEQERLLTTIWTGNLRDAEREHQFCREHPSDERVPLLLESLAHGYFRAGDIAKIAEVSESLMDDARATTPRKAQIRLWCGQTRQRAGDYQGAIADFRRAVQLDPTFREAKLILGETIVRIEPEEAYQLFDQLRDRPEPRVQLGLARAERNRGNLNESSKLLDAILTDDNKNVDSLIERAGLSLDLRRPEAAETDARTALGIKPDDRDALVVLERALIALGKDSSEIRGRLQRIDDDIQKKIHALFPGGKP